MNQPLRILAILHMPWDRNLGGSRVQLELAEEFVKMGHSVEKFDYFDAFPEAKTSILSSLTRPSFSKYATAFVRANAHRFDIIDAHQGNLPWSKEELGFNGVLVARSVGLHAFYAEFARIERKKFPPQKLKVRLFNQLSSWRQKWDASLYPQSLQKCDLINVPNRDELAYLRDVMGLGDKTFVFPFGLSQTRLSAFTNAIKPATVRLATPTVAFIGTWCPRKGSRDFGTLIAQIKQKIPTVRFLFLGTGLTAKAVLEDLPGQEDCVEIIPRYDSKELPNLISGVTVGVFPSYIEGFGFAVLEKLACGIPTVAYDVPGPREMLQDFDPPLMVPAGDIAAARDRVVQLLQLDPTHYTELSQRCVTVAQRFTWDTIARNTLEIYQQFLPPRRKE